MQFEFASQVLDLIVSGQEEQQELAWQLLLGILESEDTDSTLLTELYLLYTFGHDKFLKRQVNKLIHEVWLREHKGYRHEFSRSSNPRKFSAEPAFSEAQLQGVFQKEHLKAKLGKILQFCYKAFPLYRTLEILMPIKNALEWTENHVLVRGKLAYFMIRDVQMKQRVSTATFLFIWKICNAEQKQLLLETTLNYAYPEKVKKKRPLPASQYLWGEPSEDKQAKPFEKKTIVYFYSNLWKECNLAQKRLLITMLIKKYKSWWHFPAKMMENVLQKASDQQREDFLKLFLSDNGQQLSLVASELTVVPKEIFQFKKLRSLLLTGSNDYEIPVEIFQLPELTELEIGGILPKEMPLNKKIINLSLNQEKIPDLFEALPNLKVVKLQTNLSIKRREKRQEIKEVIDLPESFRELQDLRMVKSPLPLSPLQLPDYLEGYNLWKNPTLYHFQDKPVYGPCVYLHKDYKHKISNLGESLAGKSWHRRFCYFAWGIRI